VQFVSEIFSIVGVLATSVTCTAVLGHSLTGLFSAISQVRPGLQRNFWRSLGCDFFGL